MTDRALRDLDGIYQYIAKALMEPGVARGLIDEIESGILSLDSMPHRCSERK
jgi:plasmid stabilization system protein ParE